MSKTASVFTGKSPSTGRKNSSSGREVQNVSSCMLCGKVFKYKRCLSRHLLMEHEVPDKSEKVAVKRKLLDKAESDHVFQENEEESIRRMQEGFLPDKKSLAIKDSVKAQNKVKKVSVQSHYRFQSYEPGRSESRASSSDCSYDDTKLDSLEQKGIEHDSEDSCGNAANINHRFEDNESPLSYKCFFCNCKFESGKVLHEHYRIAHGPSPVADDSSSVSRSIDENCDDDGDDDDDDDDISIAVDGPSENIVTEPDFESIKGAIKGNFFRRSVERSEVPDNVTDKSDEQSTLEDDASDDSGEEVEVFCETSTKNSGCKDLDVLKYKLTAGTDEVLVSRVVGLNVNSGEKSYLFKCHMCAKVFLTLDKLQEHLCCHLPKYRKTYMCYHCGQLFSHRLHYKAHLSEYHRAVENNATSSSDHQSLSNDANEDVDIKDPVPVNCDQSAEKFVDASAESKANLLNIKETAVVEDQNYLLEDKKPIKDDSPSKKDTSSAATSSVSSSPNLVVNNAGSRVGYQCNYCAKMFDRHFSLNRHLRSHTGVKPCYCQFCGKGFSESRNLRHHIIRFHSDGSERHLLRRYRNGEVIKSHQSVSVTKGEGKSGSSSKSLPTHVRLANSNRLAPISNMSCSKLSTDGAELDIPQQKSGWTIADSEGLKKWLSESTYVTSRSDVHGDGRRDNSQPHRVSDSTTTTTIDVPKSHSQKLHHHHHHHHHHNAIESNVNKCNSLDKLIDEELQILAEQKLSPLRSVRKSQIQQNNHGVNTRRSSSTDNQPTSSSIPVATETDSTDSVASGITFCSPEDLDSLKLMSSVASLISPLSPPSSVSTTTAVDGSTNNSNKPNKKNGYFSHYFPRLDVVSKPVSRSEVCKPHVLPDGKVVYPCFYCHKQFGSTSDVNRHMDFHEDVRPYKCKLCNYYSRTNNQLKIHMMRHQGIKDYLCEVCNYYAVTQSDLNRHKKTKTHRARCRNVCQLCGLGYFTSQMKAAHMLSYHLGFPLPADENGTEPTNSQDLCDIEHSEEGCAITSSNFSGMKIS